MNIGKYVELYSEDLKLKNYSENTISNYTNQVKLFLEYFNNVATKPSEISEKQIKQWLLLANSINGRKHRISAVKLFYQLTGKQPLKFKHIEYPRSEKKLPKIIEKEFLLDAISKIENTKHKAIIALAYSTGMRVSEVCNLKIADIDSKRMIIIIRQSKGRKDRIVGLSEKNSWYFANLLHGLQAKRIFIQRSIRGAIFAHKLQPNCKEIFRKRLSLSFIATF